MGAVESVYAGGKCCSTKAEAKAALQYLREKMSPKVYLEMYIGMDEWNEHSFDVMVALHKHSYAELDQYLKIAAISPPHYFLYFFVDDPDVKEILSSMEDVPESLAPVVALMQAT